MKLNKKAHQEMPVWLAITSIFIMLVIGYVILEDENNISQIPSWWMIIGILLGLILILGIGYIYLRYNSTNYKDKR